MAVGVGVTLLPLLYFKYYGFFSLNITNAASALGLGAHLPLLLLVLPVGVSFFTFMAVSYVVDVYRGHAQPSSWVDVFLYLSFFPHLVAGPIVRPDELIPQLDVRRDPRHRRGRLGVADPGRLFKKVVISSYLATTIVDPVFGDPSRQSAIDAIFGIVGYAVVIYADFSGYTDIAIGVAKLLGFQFPQNFDRPYSARSLQDFWRRWHMTPLALAARLPLHPAGRVEEGRARTYVNIVATMVLGGLWHGAAWTFVFWGLYHGIGQALGAWKRTNLPRREDTPILVWGQRLSTFALVCIGWVFFRADSMATAFELLGRLVTAGRPRPRR